MKYRRLLGMACMLLLFANESKPASATVQVITLGSTWSEYDTFLGGIGVQTLSGQSSSGFTSAHSGGVTAISEYPRVYQEFSGFDLSQVGQKFEVSFDVQFHTVLDANESDFRFGFVDRSTNQGMGPVMLTMGQCCGGAGRMRYDDSITDGTTTFSPGNYSGFLSMSGTIGGIAAGDLDLGVAGNLGTTHTITTTLERVERTVDAAGTVVNGLYEEVTWSSDAPGTPTRFGDFDFQGLPYEYLAANFEETLFTQEIVNGADLAVWKTNFGLTGTATQSQGDADEDQGVDGADFLTWQREFGTVGLAVYEDDLFNLNGKIENIDGLGFALMDNDPFFDPGDFSTDGSFTISNFVMTYDDGLPLVGAAVPEPSSWLLGLIVVAAVASQRKGPRRWSLPRNPTLARRLR